VPNRILRRRKSFITPRTGGRLRHKIFRHQTRRLGRELQLEAFNDPQVDLQEVKVPRRHRRHLYRPRTQERLQGLPPFVLCVTHKPYCLICVKIDSIYADVGVN